MSQQSEGPSETPPPPNGALAPLSNPDYRRLLASNALWWQFMWMEIIVAGWLVLELTDSAWQVSLIGFYRMAPLLQAEHESDGITAINIDPGFTWTEAMAALDLHNFGGAPPEATGTVVAWLAEDIERTAEWRGRTLNSLELCAQLGLVEGWPPADG